MLCLSRVGCCLLHHRMSVLVRAPASSFLTQLPVGVPRTTLKGDADAWAPAIQWETQMEVLASGLDLSYSWPLWLFGE